MSDEILRPRSIYLPQSVINDVKKKAGPRQESAFIRDAIIAKLEGLDDFGSGYNKAIRDVCKLIEATKEAYIVLIGNDRLGSILIENIRMLEQNGK